MSETAPERTWRWGGQGETSSPEALVRDGAKYGVEVMTPDKANALESRAALVGRLVEYASHGLSCPAHPGWERPAPCTCGLDALIAEAKSLHPQEPGGAG